MGFPEEWDLNLELLVTVLLPGEEDLPKSRMHREESIANRWEWGEERGFCLDSLNAFVFNVYT